MKYIANKLDDNLMKYFLILYCLMNGYLKQLKEHMSHNMYNHFQLGQFLK